MAQRSGCEIRRSNLEAYLFADVNCWHSIDDHWLSRGQTTAHHDLVTPVLGLANHRLLQSGLSNFDCRGLCS